MNKEQLLDLSERVKEVAGVDVPIIVGSQSIYAVTPLPPESVRQSVECDFLLLAAGAQAYRAVIEQIRLRQRLPGRARLLRRRCRLGDRGPTHRLAVAPCAA